jgi:hypothetical protein
LKAIVKVTCPRAKIGLPGGDQPLFFHQHGAAIAFIGLGVALKLIPIFCVSLAARLGRHALILACVTAALSLIYLGMTWEYVLLIRRNVPTTFVLSYGYKVIFLGIDFIRSEAGLSPAGLADTSVPVATAIAVLICAAGVALNSFRKQHKVFSVDVSSAGTAFSFGAGIYCGTYLLGTNFIYRLMFLLLCVPQLLDWLTIQKCRADRSASITELGLLGAVLGALWLNGNANGHSTFLLLPQLLDWFLFFGMATVLMLNLLRAWGWLIPGFKDLRPSMTMIAR